MQSINLIIVQIKPAKCLEANIIVHSGLGAGGTAFFALVGALIL